MALTVEFIYLAARLAWQWMKKRGIIVCALSFWFIYLAARLARLWDKRTRNNCVRVKCKIRIFSGSLGSKSNRRY